ncbi:U11/U12 small nuclear ribonucleoprotein 65 kDa protein-like isoform X1 [Lucilia cuprina]|uniref:U11/U12 small nuclear ribonucleoprotein 65 kDa protein-like isoform X1 n=1 Tax=Lucilia cuprina TaxID=7375 RepID=UPI001F07067C|nr:U11/U12 small nuclear ribonucleoprotein 65 kDa protein-like isoform X1 [Lucilia cuprina]
MDKKVRQESTTLIFKNIPKQMEDLTGLLDKLKLPAREVKPFGRKRALIIFQEKNEAEKALSALKELEFNGNCCNIAIFCKDKPNNNSIEQKPKNSLRKSNKSIQTQLEDTNGTQQALNKQQEQLNKYVQKLYAVEDELGFNQPPAPYLKYTYPPINKDILDNICISLLSNKRFYTQVLHLMNRMNLEPPFNKRNYKFTATGVPKEAQTQTDEIQIQEKQNLTIQEEIESELESAEEDEHKPKAKPTQQLKRKLIDQPEQYKKKARQMLLSTQKLNKETHKKPAKTNLSIKEIFETTEHNLTTSNKIDMQLKSNKKETTKSLISLPLNLKTQKLPPEELEKLAIYKNYQKGLISNKLYIKNLHKDVTADDLKLIYQRYLKTEDLSLDIKVMQHGRMKGQAFVTFQGQEMDIIKPLIAEALEETNGFVLRDKPMVVCYGKQT